MITCQGYRGRFDIYCTYEGSMRLFLVFVFFGLNQTPDWSFCLINQLLSWLAHDINIGRQRYSQVSCILTVSQISLSGINEEEQHEILLMNNHHSITPLFFQLPIKVVARGVTINPLWPKLFIISGNENK